MRIKVIKPEGAALECGIQCDDCGYWRVHSIRLIGLLALVMKAFKPGTEEIFEIDDTYFRGCPNKRKCPNRKEK